MHYNFQEDPGSSREVFNLEFHTRLSSKTLVIFKILDWKKKNTLRMLCQEIRLEAYVQKENVLKH